MNSRVHRSNQHGAALAISLIFLLVLTILSIAAMSGSGLQERMAGGIRQTNLAFQAAESGVLAGESWIGSTQRITRPDPILSCTSSSTCPINQVWATDVTISGVLTNLNPLTFDWANFNWTANAVELGTTGTKEMPLVIADPRYLIQESGSRSDDFSANPESLTYFYTVTARGVAATTQHASIVQSVYARRF